ncbi:MAG: transporter, partial [Candidatus Thermofonsia Clade 3 bacterium]
MMVAAVLLIAAAIVAVEAVALGLKSTIAAGIYTGARTNTPALAQVLNFVTHSSLRDAGPAVATEPVVGYSVAYPLGVIGPILAILLMQRVWRIDYKKDAEQVRDMFPIEQEIYNRTAQVANPAVIGASLRALSRQRGWRVVFGRVKHGDKVELAIDDLILHEGDLISVIGAPEDVDRSAYDFRRVFVSNPDLVGRKLADLDLPHRFGAIVTRVRRGDIELLAHGDLVLELGDRVRFVAPRDQMRAISQYFGDSYKKLSEINLGTLGLGLALGLLVGMIPISLPGGLQFKLGEAGGPLLVALKINATS